MVVLAALLGACGGGGGEDGASPAPVDTRYRLARVFAAQSFANVTDVQMQAYPPEAARSGERVFVVEQAGRIRVFDVDAPAAPARTFLDISGRVTAGGEQGLLGLAFDPDFASNGRFYVHYTVDTNSIPQRIRVSRFTVADRIDAPNTAAPDSEELLLVVDQAGEGPPATNHNGGTLAFSPADGLLYISVGDGGGANDPAGNGQDTATLSGALLRIDVNNRDPGLNYAIPPDNPFADRAGARGEIFAYGLRNPFKFSFDANGDLWIGDVGQGALEEVDFLAAGDTRGPNFGWDCREGSRAGGRPDAACNGVPRRAFVDPVDEYSLGGGQSITGGFVYRGDGLPGLVGRYVYADFVAGRVWAHDPASGQTEVLTDSALRISTFARDGAGEIYLVNYGDGGIYQLVAEHQPERSD